MFQILIAVLVVILLLLVGISWFQHRAISQIKELQAVGDHLKKEDLASQLAQGKKMQLIGDAKETFNKLEKKYQEELIPQLKQVETRGKELQAAVKTSQLLTINSAINDYRTLVGRTSDEAQKIQKTLQDLQQQEQRHHQAIDHLRQQYRHFHQQMDEKNFEYGDTIKKLSQQLNDLEQRFAKFVDLTNKGDLEAAQEILSELQNDNQKFDHLLKTVPKLYKPLVTEFPDQLDELQKGYATLKKDHFNFTEQKLDVKIEQLQEKLKQTVAQLNDLEIDIVAQSSKDLADEIDNLYGVMQKEIDAQPEAKHLMDVMGKFIPHAQHQNEELIAELRRLNLSYTFNNNEIEAARQLNEQIKTINKQFQEDQKAFADQTVIYSQVVDRQKANQKELTLVEEKQEKINDEVAKLQTDEQRARKMLQKYSVDLRTIKRQVEQLNLPGVSQDYVDYFMGVSDEVKKLNAELHEYKINMDDVTKQLIMVESDLESLQVKTNDLRDSAELTERLLQYANRFSDNEEIEKAAEKSRKLFSKYEYTKSLEAIGTALEKVEPGSFKRIEDSYYSEND